MYEDKTFENIMEDMMEEVEGEDIDKSEGSLIWNAVSKMAMQLEEAYEAIDYVYDNLFVDTMDLEHLIAFGSEIGIPIIEATPAIFKAQTNCAFEEGDVFEHTEQDLTYMITDIIDEENNIYRVECEDPGADANKYLGDIEPEEYVEDFESGQLIELLVSGTDEEDEEVYRERIINSWGTRSFAGNKAYYIEEVGDIDGVGAVKVERVTDQNTTVKLTVLDSSYGVPSAEKIEVIQEAVDPIGSSGEGDGVAPIGAKVTVQAASASVINVSATIELQNGYELADIESQLVGVVDDYFLSLAEKWQSTTGQIVRRAKIESGLVNVEGIADVSAVKLNGSDANIELTTYQVAQKGTCTWNIQT